MALRLLVYLIPLVISLLVGGCGDPDSLDEGIATGGTTQLTMRLMVSQQAIARHETRELLPGQTRQVESLRLLRVDVSGVGIPESIRVDCPIPAGSAQCHVTETVETLLVTINLAVPSGTRRQVKGTGFDQQGNVILIGITTVDITDVTQTVTLLLAPLTGSSGG